MITVQQLRRAKGIEGYYASALSEGASEYYASQRGVWYGKGAERIQLPDEVSKEDLIAVCNNEVPKTRERLTVRTNDVRHEPVIDKETGQPVIDPKTGEVKMREVSNRRIAVDFTFSVPKSVSMHLALTHDVEAERLVHEAMRETLDDMEKAIQTRVRTAGADHDRTTGNAIVACFVHRTTRPVSGRVDPHWHCHCLLMNATYDDVEGRWKAAQLGNLIAEKPKYEAMFHSRVAEKLLAARYALRKTKQDFEISIFTEEEIRVFCKRTAQINKLEETHRSALQKRTDAIVRAGAKRGMLIDYESTYQAELAKMSAELREAKRTARLEGAALEEDWRSQFAPDRVAQFTIAASKAGSSAGFIEPNRAISLAVRHAFENRSVVEEAEMITEILKWGIGTVPVRAAEAFVESARFLRNPHKSGRVTIQEVYEEEKNVIGTVMAGKGLYARIGQAWKIQNKLVAGDKGQTNAVYYVLRSADLLTGIEGKPGTGKTTMICEAAAAIRVLTGQDPVMLAPTASAVQTLKDAGYTVADTVANFQDKIEFHDAARDRIIWCDEASLLDNKDFTWLLNFVRDNECRLICSGDPRQHGAVERGHPFEMLVARGVLKCAKLEKIYRQEDNPELLAIIEDFHAQKPEEAVKKLELSGIIRESDTHTDARLKLVDDLIEEFKAGHKVMVVAPVHRDGRKVADSVRAAMRMEGFLGQKERQIGWLESANLSSAQQMDPTHYEPGQVIEFCRRAKGGFKSGGRWEVSRKEGERVFVTRNAVEKALPLRQWKTFNVYRCDTMPVAVGEHLLITKNNRAANLRNGELRKVAAIDGDRITLDNGRQLNSSRPLHVRQGYTVTSQTSQSHESVKMFGFLPVSSTSQVNVVQMLVTLSRPTREARLYTDSGEVLLEAALRPGHGMSAVELLDGESEPEVDLWQIGHNRDKRQKEAELTPEVQRSRQMTKREQICETIRKSPNREMGMEKCIER
jgi:conjugative relaxase-like TrwC/TraI family protein